MFSRQLSLFRQKVRELRDTRLASLVLRRGHNASRRRRSQVNEVDVGRRGRGAVGAGHDLRDSPCHIRQTRHTVTLRVSSVTPALFELATFLRFSVRPCRPCELTAGKDPKGPQERLLQQYLQKVRQNAAQVLRACTGSESGRRSRQRS